MNHGVQVDMQSTRIACIGLEGVGDRPAPKDPVPIQYSHDLSRSYMLSRLRENEMHGALCVSEYVVDSQILAKVHVCSV